MLDCFYTLPHQGFKYVIHVSQVAHKILYAGSWMIFVINIYENLGNLSLVTDQISHRI